MILTQGWYSDVPMGDLGPTRQKVGGIAIWRLGQQGNGSVDYVGARTFMPQADLVQAGKLAALGQISAALSDAINQPLAAMRNHATMSRALIDRGAGTGIYRTGAGFSQVQREGVRDRVRGADRDRLEIWRRSVFFAYAAGSGVNHCTGARVDSKCIGDDSGARQSNGFLGRASQLAAAAVTTVTAQAG